jgi:hypothetical protein
MQTVTFSLNLFHKNCNENENELPVSFGLVYYTKRCVSPACRNPQNDMKFHFIVNLIDTRPHNWDANPLKGLLSMHKVD